MQVGLSLLKHRGRLVAGYLPTFSLMNDAVSHGRWQQLPNLTGLLRTPATFAPYLLQRVTIKDLVRGEVSWDAEATVGDFILLRSTGVPVYNFCVAGKKCSIRCLVATLDDPPHPHG